MRFHRAVPRERVPFRQRRVPLARLDAQRGGAQPGQGAVSGGRLGGDRCEAAGRDGGVRPGLGGGARGGEVALGGGHRGPVLPPAPALHPGDGQHGEQRRAGQEAAVAVEQLLGALGAEILLHLVEDVGHGLPSRCWRAGGRA